MPDPITPTLPDPQASVDAALGSIATPTTATPTPTVSEPPKVEIPPAPVMNAPMGDETPLAFAAPTLNAMPATPAHNVVPEAPKLEPMPSVGSSYLPPVPPAPISTPPVEDKPKKKSKIGLVLGIFLMIFGVAGGFWGYYRYSVKQAQIAVINALEDEEIKFLKKSVAIDKKIPIKKANGTVIIPKKVADITDEETEQIAVPALKLEEAKAIVQNVLKDGGSVSIAEGATCVAGYTGLCMGGLGSCVTGTCVAIPSKALKAMCGNLFTQKQTNTVTPANAALDPCKNGTCTLTQAMVDAGCIVQRVTCKVGGKSGVACEETIASTINTTQPLSVDNTAKCGSEQIDVICKELCDGSTQPLSFANKITGIDCSTVKTTTVDEPPTTPPSTPPVVPVLACTGLTNTPAAPVIGQTVTFTCAGTITPTGAATLSYKFRYSLNDGADQLLANTTPTTAQLPITACGTYSVQCKVCATIAGVLKCDPTWTGAIQ